MIKSLFGSRPDRLGAGGGGEAVRARPRVGARAGRRDPPIHRQVAAVSDRPLPRQDGRSGCAPLVERERDLRADLEPAVRVLGADHDGGELRRRRSRALLRSGRRAARRGGPTT